jgi:hypothetical protein
VILCVVHDRAVVVVDDDDDDGEGCNAVDVSETKEYHLGNAHLLHMLSCLTYRLFILEPMALKILKFDPTEDVTKNAAFPCLARIMFDMVDLAVGFLGPDLDPLTEDLLALGSRHVAYGVEPEYFCAMGVALIYALKSLLPGFSETDEESWTAVFRFMILRMATGLREERKRQQKQRLHL